MRYDFYVRHYKLIAFVILIVLLITGTQYSKAEQIGAVVYGYCDEPLNVRLEMSIDSEWVSQYPAKSTIILNEKMGDWYKVEGGYVKAEYVHDEVEIYKMGRVNGYTIIFGEASFWGGSVGYVEEGSEELFVRKKNGFLELNGGGWVLESFITFDYVMEPQIHETWLTAQDFQAWNMVNLPIKYLGTLTERTKAQGVTRKGGLYFTGQIPLYDIVDGEAYFPAGRNIYKLSIDKFATFENVGSSYQTIAAYRTTFYDSIRGRKFNIRKVSEILDGTVIKAGARFSYNETTGPRDEASGYAEAYEIRNGESVIGFGGGVCQPSSTIYAAIMHNDSFKVTARKPHGTEVMYLPLDMDATVSYGSVDFKFINNHPFDVVLNVKSEGDVCLVTITRVE